MTSRTRVVVVTNLHNPSGIRSQDDVLRAVARVAASRGAFLVVDEVYAPFDALVDARGVFSSSARKVAPNIVAVSSLTKCYGLGAHRIGWLLGPAEMMGRVDDAITASCGHLPVSHARIALMALKRITALAERSRTLLAGKRAHVEAWVAGQGLDWSAPQEGLFGFVRVPGAGDLTAAIEAGAHHHEVLVAPGSFFGVPDGFRLAWSGPRTMVEEGLGRLENVLRGAAMR
jgi:aspartate/methionine/tyrosine aminotransferase